MDIEQLRECVEAAWQNRERLQEASTREALDRVVALLDAGRLRTAEPVDADGSAWRVNEWVKKAILLYFPVRKMRTMRAGELEWYDKMELKHDFDRLGVRAVPHAVARYGAYIAPGVILMPSYVNIGARVGTGTLVDTWATVGSCAQIGERVHLSGGVGIGGVLEPVQAAPVIVEDDCFIGSRAIVVEGARICREAVLGSNVVITGSTHIIDVTGPEPVEYRGYVPAGSVVIPGTYPRRFPAGEYGVTCALIIGRRKPSTDKKTSLNEALRDFGVAV
ncbi:2,3,4,5-tetrahydropyridine-2,6-dicarboxylate N-succinyltransferase [uncultured Alistipes sp.]|uniref:2,3,4,5-tetrahydropyridine-2,6-dicarboxylate N-succinyltransferase n=1 Tax=Alistipes sp. TaxID=1872444 RepID=UPI00266D32AC|nr:2,3,4,5-tetrahydropyridine-2,6-dicarboxylate N-succinyltransferase [uncultured Alistipes sp.]